MASFCFGPNGEVVVKMLYDSQKYYTCMVVLLTARWLNVARMSLLDGSFHTNEHEARTEREE